MTWRIASPRDAALAILAPRFQNGCETEPGFDNALPLADFQRDGAARAWAILQRRRGVLVADSVGLGKTFVALALIGRACCEDLRVLLVIPAGLRRMWKSELKRAAEAQPVAIVSHTQLARGYLGADARFDFVVVDEAHAFRNPKTRRYRALRRITIAARVVLLTATPVNNSLWDLYFQLRLFCSDSAFQDWGVGSLRAAFEDGRDIDRVLQAVMVRRTRAEVRLSESRLAFPQTVALRAVGYSLPIPPAELARLLGGLTFPGHTADAAQLLRFGFLKRLESSVHALSVTVRRQIRFCEHLSQALGQGLRLTPSTFRKLYPDRGFDQLVLDALALDPRRPAGQPSLSAIRAELEVLRELKDHLAHVQDDKLSRLGGMLSERCGRKTIVFTEYRDTAHYLAGALRRRFAIGLIDGSGAWIGDTLASRQHVVGRFAPIANGVPNVHAREAVEVLVATDVLAEGMNLQDADAVVSYDLPWNPIRLIQRAGRVDRIGSPHKSVSIYNMLPDRDLDAFLGLVRTIRSKLETVRGSVGLERPVLEPEQVIERLRTCSYDVLTEIEGGREAELRRAFQAAEPRLDDCLPIGWLPGASGRRALIGLARGAEWAVMSLDLGAGPALNSVDTDALLLRAFACDAVREGRADELIRAAKHAVERVNADAGRRVAARSAGSRLARRIRAFLAEAPLFGAGPDLFARCDRVLQGLAGDLSVDAETRLEHLARKPFGSLEAILDAVENALSERGFEAAPSREWTLTGVLVTG